MRKILWYAFLLIPAVFTSCNLEDDSGLIPQENRKASVYKTPPADWLHVRPSHRKPGKRI